MDLQQDRLLCATLVRNIETWRSSETASSHGPQAVLATAKREADIALTHGMVRALTTSMPADPQAIHAILLKPVADHCNLRCKYCYEGIGSERFQPGQMSPDLLRKVIAEGCAQAPDNHIQFLWHGGEPLLAGLDLFRAGLDQQRIERDATGIRIRNSVQTNGTLLDDRWLDFLQESGFSIGISLDGPPAIHDAERIDARGRGTHHLVVEAIRRIQARNMEFGVIAVISAHHVPHAAEVIRHVHDLGIRNLDMHPAVGLPKENADLQNNGDLSPDDFATFMTAAFDEWLAIGDPGFRINLFRDFLRGWFGARPRTCYFNGSCGSIVAVESSGAVVPCTRPFNRALNTFGNAKSESLEAISRGAALESFRARDQKAIARTAACRWGSLCSGGCPQHRRSDAVRNAEDVAGDNPFCKCMSGNPGGHDALWSHIVSRVEETFAASVPVSMLVK